jgi:hypothetical protein
MQEADLTDVRITNHHSLILVLPLTDAASEWIRDNVDPDAQWFGQSLVVEPRYLADLCAGMQGDGLTISAGRTQ